jgi:hypothetical protein
MYKLAGSRGGVCVGYQLLRSLRDSCAAGQVAKNRACDSAFQIEGVRLAALSGQVGQAPW